MTIGYAVWPRREFFLAPGPRLTHVTHPRLSALLNEVAQASELATPEELYLIPEVNAWISRRGGRTFSGGRMVIALGLPLLAVLTPSQLRAVLAHEFGHEQGGDTILGGWIYGARLAMVRAGQNIHSSGWSGVLMYPLLWYSKLFLRITSVIARRQELIADAQAARIAGPEVAGHALTTTEAAVIAFDRYLRFEVLPVLDRGYRPPLAQGFDRYFRNQRDLAIETLETVPTQNRIDPYQSHPPLKERLSALGCAEAVRLPQSGEPSALSLLENPETFEADLLGRLTNQTIARRSKPITWEELSGPEGIDLIHSKTWDVVFRESGPRLSGITVQDLAGLAKDPEAFGRKVIPRKMLSKDYIAYSNHIVGVALARTLRKAGWSIRKEPGLPFQLKKGDATVEPFEVFSRLREEPAAAAWNKEAGRMGIGLLDLGHPGSGSSQP